jgi:hypothetical protein
MPIGTAFRHVSLSLALAAALLALWMRVLVPVGWMPVSSAQGVTYVLCGIGSVPVQAADGEAPDSDPHPPCAFAGLTPGLDAEPLLLLPLLLTMTAALALPLLRQPGQMLAWLRPPLRGPPAR